MKQFSLVKNTKGSRSAAPPKSKQSKGVLCIDIGGTAIKVLASGETERRRAPSGPKLTPIDMIAVVKELSNDWSFDKVSIGFPGPVGVNGPRSEPGNLGTGWVGFDYSAAFGFPVRIMNDAAMQALGSYDGGRMLFLGFGTGLGSCLIADNVIIPLELGQLPYRKNFNLGQLAARANLERIGKKKWRKTITKLLPGLMHAFRTDSLVIGGGNAKLFKELPAGVRLGHNLTAFRGGFRMWHLDVQEHTPDTDPLEAELAKADWKVL